MLEQAAVADVRSGAISRHDGHIVAAMRFYPRGLARELLDEYLRSLAPDEFLFRDFKRRERLHHDHVRAFAEVDYEGRFRLTERGLQDLTRLVDLSRNQDVFLVCQCQVGQACHRELLLRIAAECMGATTGRVHHRYPVFEARIAAGEITLASP